MSYKPDDNYIDVAERIAQFYDEHPDGRLICADAPMMVNVNGQDFVIVHARAFRSLDDPLPGDGWAWEPVPGTTPFTKNSELMNAQTAAIGRAIVSVGLLASRKIASAEEVRNRKAEQEVEKKPAAKKKANGKISDDMVRQLEPAVKAWLKDHPDKRDDFKLKIVALGVVSPDQEKLSDVLGQLPSEKAVAELTAWLGKND